MEYFEKSNFNPGGCLDIFDNRDYKWEEVGGAVLPFDWTKGFDIEKNLKSVVGDSFKGLKVKDQGESFSCGGQAWSYASEVLEALNTKTYEPRSAKYIYSQTWVPGGGSRGRDNSDIFVKQGVAKESVLSSYQNGLTPSEAFITRSADITEEIRRDAKGSKSSAYAQTGVDIDTVANAMAINSGIVIGVVGSNNGTWRSEFPQPPKVGEKIWRHWVFAGKANLINGVKHVYPINSWGPKAGVNGWQALSEKYFNTLLTIDPVTQIVTKVGSGGSTIFSGWTHVFAEPIDDEFSHEFKKDMKFGETNSEIIALQKALKLEKLFPEKVPSSGFYGDITRRAVLDFQLKYKIIITPLDSNNGKIAGPKTRAKLNSLYA